jgi:hypothetical protein
MFIWLIDFLKFHLYPQPFICSIELAQPAWSASILVICAALRRMRIQNMRGLRV